MKHVSILIAAFLAAALPATAGTTPAPAPAPAAAPVPELSYNNFEAGWVYRDFDGFDANNGYYIYGSYSPINPIFLFAEWGQDFGDDIDRDLFATGLGVFIPLTPRVHWVTIAGPGYISTEGAGEDDENWAFNASTGLRIKLCASAELEAAYNFSVESGDEFHSGSVGLLVNVCTNVQLTLRGYFSDDENGVGAGIRYNF